MNKSRTSNHKAAFLIATGMTAMSVLPVIAECVVQDRVKISVYHDDLSGNTMSGGGKFSSNGHYGAHRTLPFGTTVEFTDLETGETSTMIVQDRGPFVAGRIYDVPGKVWQDLRGDEDYGLTWVRARYCTPT